MNRRPTRRYVLTTAAGVGLGAIGGCLDTESEPDVAEALGIDRESDGNEGENEDERRSEESTDEKADEMQMAEFDGGAVVFVYDDGPIEDYTQAFPAHEAFDAPATAGIVSSWVGRDDRWMDTVEIGELEAAGWEIASHTTDHAPIATAKLTTGADSGERKLTTDHYRHGHHDGLTVEVIDPLGEFRTTKTVRGLAGEPGDRRVELDSPLEQHFPEGSVLRYPTAYMHESVGESKRALEAMGFTIETFLAPYDVYDEFAERYVREYYRGVANGKHGTRYNDPDEWDPFWTRRDYFIEFTTPERVMTDLDTIAKNDLVGVLGAHTFKDEVTEERIYETLAAIETRGITVLTLREAIEYLDVER